MADETLINPQQNNNGNQLVDLNQLWPTARPVTGNQSDLITQPTPPKVESDGSGYYVKDDNGQPIRTDKDGNPQPQVDPGTGEVIDPGAPSQGGFMVNVAELFYVENNLLQATKQAIDEFETFKNARLDNETWVFFAKNKKETEPYEHGRTNTPDGDTPASSDPGGNYADVVDPNPEKTAELVQTQNALMQAMGGAIQRVGQFAGKLNDAAQLYAGADKRSWVD